MVQHHHLCDDMTLITVQDGAVVMHDGKVGTEQACCCGCQCQTFATGEGFTIAQTGPWGTSSYYTYGGTCPPGAAEYCEYYSGATPSPPFLDSAEYYYAAVFTDAGPVDTVNSLQIYIQCVDGQWIAQVSYSIYGDFTDCPNGPFGVPPQVDMQWYDLTLPRDDSDCFPTGTLELGAADYVFATDYGGNEIPSSGGNAPACFNLTLPDILFGRP